MRKDWEKGEEIVAETPESSWLEPGEGNWTRVPTQHELQMRPSTKEARIPTEEDLQGSPGGLGLESWVEASFREALSLLLNREGEKPTGLGLAMAKETCPQARARLTKWAETLLHLELTLGLGSMSVQQVPVRSTISTARHLHLDLVVGWV